MPVDGSMRLNKIRKWLDDHPNLHEVCMTVEEVRSYHAEVDRLEAEVARLRELLAQQRQLTDEAWALLDHTAGPHRDTWTDAVTSWNGAYRRALREATDDRPAYDEGRQA